MYEVVVLSRFIWVPLTPEARDALFRLAERERRPIKLQAALLIERGLAAELAKTKRASEFGQPG